jgi:hypothetical protein
MTKMCPAERANQIRESEMASCMVICSFVERVRCSRCVTLIKSSCDQPMMTALSPAICNPTLDSRDVGYGNAPNAVLICCSHRLHAKLTRVVDFR